MQRLAWAKGPLGEEFEKFRGSESEGSGWARAVKNWTGIQHEVAKQDSTFWEEISRSQQNSLRILLEWWNAEYEDPATMAKTRKIILQHCNSPHGEERVPTSLTFGKSDYQKQLFENFLYELFFYGQGKAAPIQLRREKACRSAACQRLAYLTFLSMSEAPKHQMHLQGSTYHSPVGAVVEACPWLPDGKRAGLPYYLWSIETRQTVVVHDLPETPEYVVISHTWGRWRIPGAGLSIPGVDWRVPQNTIFQVQDLPAMIYNCRSTFLPCKYLWIDLFCIPQDRSERATLEIARQAEIFGAAHTAIAWLNNVDSWSGLREGILWFGATYFWASNDHIPESTGHQAIASFLESQSSNPTQLFAKFTDLFTDAPDISFGEDPCGWFTSLWTLQECLLRPDIVLCDKNWEYFRLTDSAEEAPVSLDCIIAFVNWYQLAFSDVTPEVRMPSAPAEIAALVTLTNLTALLESTILTPLVLGDRRQCESRRAEAIMAAVGATEWYHNLDQSKHEEALVLGRYPIQFLREIHEQIGARFFCANYAAFCCYWDIFRTSQGIENMVAVVTGTILPFDPLRKQSRLISGIDSPDRLDDPATKTWSLADDGTVIIPEAAIVASTSFKFRKKQDFSASLIVPLEDDPTKCVPMKGNLLEWMRENFSDIPKHAVCLLDNGAGWSQGVIVMQVYENESPPKTFAKLGDYLTVSERRLETRRHVVNWHLL
jgi:hypothetical protein